MHTVRSVVKNFLAKISLNFAQSVQIITALLIFAKGFCFCTEGTSIFNLQNKAAAVFLCNVYGGNCERPNMIRSKLRIPDSSRAATQIHSPRKELDNSSNCSPSLCGIQPFVMSHQVSIISFSEKRIQQIPRSSPTDYRHIRKQCNLLVTNIFYYNAPKLIFFFYFSKIMGTVTSGQCKIQRQKGKRSNLLPIMTDLDYRKTFGCSLYLQHVLPRSH